MFKTGITVGAIYYTRQLGVWGDCKQSEKLFNDLKAGICPKWRQFRQHISFKSPDVPPPSEVKYTIKQYTNDGIKGTFSFIQMIPTRLEKLIDDTKNTLNKSLDSTSEKKI